MSRKLIVLPYNLYQSLLREPTAPDEDITEHGPLQRTKEALWRSQRVRKGQNLSTRNVLHQQQMRNYLRARRAFVEKPMNVEVAGLKTLLKQKADEISALPLAPARRGAPALPGDELMEQQPVVVPTATPPPRLPASAPAKLRRRMSKRERLVVRKRRPREAAPSRSTPASKRTRSQEEEEEIDEEEFTDANEDLFQPNQPSPKRPHGKRTQRRVSLENFARDTINTYIDDLINHVQSNTKRFHLTADGQQIASEDGSPVKDSNVPATIRYLLFPTVFPKAPGYSYVQEKLSSDPLFRSIKAHIRGFEYLPQEYRGAGKKKRRPRFSKNPLVFAKQCRAKRGQVCKTVVFRPTLWRTK